MTVLNRVTLLNEASVSATGRWFELDYRLDPGGVLRTITGTLTVGDTVFLEATNQPVMDAGVTLAPTVIVTVSAFTTTPFVAALGGQFGAIRFRKTGTTGPAVVACII